MKVYTRTGDKGTTGLADGSRLEKDDIRIESYGTVDELNSIVALCGLHLNELPYEKSTLLNEWLVAIQNDLFNIGSDLATPLTARWPHMVLVSDVEIKILEKMIDFCQESLSPLREFVLPGGSLSNSYFHLARTTCRRAERIVVTLSKQQSINEFVIPYLNRLSDLFFTLARFVQQEMNTKEVTWSKTGGVRMINLVD